MASSLLSLSDYHIQRPEKIRWRFPQVSEAEVLNHIQSKTLRKFLRRADELLTKNDLTWEWNTLDQAAFAEWLPYYQTKMSELEYDVIASTEWFEKRQQQGFEIEGMFVRNAAGETVGTGIFTWHPQDQKGTFAFKASERIDLTNEPNSSLGAVLDYFFIREMTRRNAKIISAGQSRNAFGVVNSFGYLDYKLRFGYQPGASDTASVVDNVPLDENGRVLCYGVRNQQLTLFAFKPQGDATTFEQARFATPELPYEIIEYPRDSVIK